MKNRNLQEKSNPTRLLLRGALALTVAAFFLPAAVFGASARSGQRAVPVPAEESVSEAAPEAEQPEGERKTASVKSGEAEKGEKAKKAKETEQPTRAPTLRVKRNGKVKTMALEDYLWGVVAAEVPAKFEQEALNAQAIAARTYTLYRVEHGSPNHPEADICTDPGCCQAWITRKDRLAAWEKDRREAYAEKISRAVEETRGRVLCYQDQPIMAAFHDSSPGRTRSALEVWGSELPYLQAVSSPENQKEVPDYYSVVTVKAKRFQKLLLAEFPHMKLGKQPEKWLGKVTCDAGGLPVSIAIGGVDVSTRTLRTLFGLRSACVTAECDGKRVTFYVTGYGHGVGMSQYGANIMAEQGNGAEEILRHYYTGAEVVQWYR